MPSIILSKAFLPAPHSIPAKKLGTLAYWASPKAGDPPTSLQFGEEVIQFQGNEIHVGTEEGDFTSLSFREPGHATAIFQYHAKVWFNQNIPGGIARIVVTPLDEGDFGHDITILSVKYPP